MYNSFHVFARWAVLTKRAATPAETQVQLTERLDQLSDRVDQLVRTVAGLVEARNSTKQESGTV
jgi:hypothetical protein